MDTFMPVDLTSVYRRLNLIDPAVKLRTAGNMWGGSGDIGGSPRATGTKLTPEQIVQACRDAFRKPTLLRQGLRFLFAAGMAAGIVSLSALISFLLSPSRLAAGYLFRNPDHVFILNMILLTVVCLALLSHRKPWLYGLIAPLGRDWWFVLPAALLAGFAGGVWLPAAAVGRNPSYQFVIYTLLAMPVVSELLFRSLVHGLLAENNRIQTYQSAWFISWPVTGSAVLNTCFFAYLLYHSTHFQDFLGADAIRLFAAFALALAVGIVRERSQSILPACLFHILTAACVGFGSYAIGGVISAF